jgi:hypothetical protein
MVVSEFSVARSRRGKIPLCGERVDFAVTVNLRIKAGHWQLQFGLSERVKGSGDNRIRIWRRPDRRTRSLCRGYSTDFRVRFTTARSCPSFIWTGTRQL